MIWLTQCKVVLSNIEISQGSVATNLKQVAAFAVYC